MRKLILLLAVIVAQVANAKETLTFVSNPILVMDKEQMVYRPENMSYSGKLRTVVEVEADSIKALLKTIRSQLCSANPKGEFQASFSVDASGKVLGLGASATSGLQATIKCD